MAEATDDRAAVPAPDLDAAEDGRRMRRIGALHFVAAMGALTLWGAADSWAATSGWALASAVAVANAVIAGFVLTSVLHEWGHFVGARLAGAFAPVLEKPRQYFFMFDFPFDRNDERQFVWMSLGGILVPWLLVLLALVLVPIDTASRAMLLAVLVGRAVFVSVFEVPVVARTLGGGAPQAELVRQLKAGALKTGRNVGIAVAALVWLAL